MALAVAHHGQNPVVPQRALSGGIVAGVELPGGSGGGIIDAEASRIGGNVAYIAIPPQGFRSVILTSSTFFVSYRKLNCLQNKFMNKAVFLDRDGTLNVEKNYLYKIEDFEFLPGVIEGLKLLQDAGYLLIIITNQSGIARGYYTEDDFNRLNNWMLNKLTEYGVNITKVYYCPHLPNATVEAYRKNCDCRKPQLGLFYKAIKDFNIDVSQSFAIGDKMRDLSICQQKECQGVLIGNNEDSMTLNKVRKGDCKNIVYKNNIEDCIEFIINHESFG